LNQQASVDIAAVTDQQASVDIALPAGTDRQASADT
jgi:hypothetical protein